MEISKQRLMQINWNEFKIQFTKNKQLKEKFQ